jgi:hypothetical protein
MERTTEAIKINSPKQIIDFVTNIAQIPRNKEIKLIFAPSVQPLREKVGERLEAELKGFVVSVHTIEPIIKVAKLMTDEEIEAHQSFFERCAQDYGILGKELIYKLAELLEVEIDVTNPLRTFNPFKMNGKQIGEMGEWKYFLHGGHCGFHHKHSEQHIEVPLMSGLEFGTLDPYFFANYILSTKSYLPLPVAIYELYYDGNRIIEKMLALGKFEKIATPYQKDSFDVLVTNRN